MSYNKLYMKNIITQNFSIVIKNWYLFKIPGIRHYCLLTAQQVRSCRPNCYNPIPTVTCSHGLYSECKVLG